MGLRETLRRMRPLFREGGRFQRFETVFEMVDQALQAPGETTRFAPHVRDSLDLKRVMWCVLLAVLPCVLIGIYNTGYQANLALQSLGQAGVEGWRGALLSGIGYDPDRLLANFAHGLLHFLPVYVVTVLAAGVWSVLFAALRNHDVDEGALVTATLLVLILPPTIPLWQAALGVSFGIVIGKEIFGGIGKNFVNPALAGWAFLYFAYPEGASGDQVWIAIEGYGRPTPLMAAQSGGVDAILSHGTTWVDSFVGLVPGTLGSQTVLGSLLGAALLVYAGVASWRIMAGVILGASLTVFLFNLAGSAENAMATVPWHWHMALGSLVFCAVYMATDPVSAAQTNRGRWAYGLLIGFVTVLIRVLNPAFPEGVMLAILFGNLVAPLLDNIDMRLNIRRRLRRDVHI